ncbi:MAG: hypothetical protein PPHEINF_6310 [uncultured Paraburkholderia sp.]|nr:MAG: hypothetical protein PPHEINF_6310 [uncultured Paraburkholderia sp.]CAH2810193.1 MAG: hypothetical protein PPHEESC_6241 [uncultured Paraburkholderia sp.]CAH2945707.1 MAG: hypothetical protein PPHEMADMSA_6341 [uncultured Paraburkholderia sp.]CAH2945855.1 MAG: hypothetical protein PPHERAN_6302 [uncultured Paraburkholderia sp.]
MSFPIVGYGSGGGTSSITVMPTFASELLIPKLKDSDDRTPDVHVRRGRSHRDAYIRHLEFRSGDPLAQANVDTASSDCWLGMSCLSACPRLRKARRRSARTVKECLQKSFS